MAGVLIAALVMASAGFGLRLFMDRAAENRLRPAEDIAIRDLRAPLPENGALACPPGYCDLAGAIASPVFAVATDRLRRDFARVAAGEPRVITLKDEPRRLVLLQRSALFRFPDIVVAEFVPLGPERSSVAIYSHARYGRADFGVNRSRIERWLKRLETLAAQ